MRQASRAHRALGFGVCLLILLCASIKPASANPAKVIFIADNQHVEDHGYSVGEQSFFADRLIPVARRPALTNIFSLRILEYVLKSELAKPNEAAADVVIHLGDAINNGCVSEFREFSAVMSAHTRDGLGNAVPWYMAPGNHDSYFLGISHPMKEVSSRFLPSNLENKTYWFSLCRNMRSFDRLTKTGSLNATIMHKQKFIKSYLSAVVPRFNADLNFGGIAADSDYAKLKNRHDIDLRCSEVTGATHLHRVCWTVSKSESWKGFVVQEVRVPVGSNGKVQSLILVDTCDYPRPPRLLSVRMFQGAGSNGAVSDAQLAIIEKWLKENKQAGISSTLVGHHPFSSLNRRSLFGVRFGSTRVGGTFRNWAHRDLFDRYYSAHTHTGFSEAHATNEDGSAAFVEVNVGSLVDRPSEYVKLTLNEEASGSISSHCLRRPLTRRKVPASQVPKDPHCEMGGRDGLYNRCFNLLDRNVGRDPDVPDRYANFPQEAFGVVQRSIYARIDLRKDFASDKRGQRSHIRALAQELFGYSSIFSAVNIEADLASVNRTVTPVCYRAYTDTCDATCKDGNNNTACTPEQENSWLKNRRDRCRKANTLESQCDKNFDVRKLADGDWVRTNGRVLDSSRTVRRFIHFYLSKVLSASRSPEVCAGDRWDIAGICVGPYPLEIELARFNEVVKLFLQRNSGPKTANRNLCYALLSSNFDIVSRDQFNPHYD